MLFTNEKMARKHHILKENALLDISPSGEIMLSQRLTIILHCDMAFTSFPFDSQICEIGIESMAKVTRYNHAIPVTVFFTV